MVNGKSQKVAESGKKKSGKGREKSGNGETTKILKAKPKITLQKAITEDNPDLFKVLPFSYRALRASLFGKCPQIREYLLNFRGREMFKALFEHGEVNMISKFYSKEDGWRYPIKNVFANGFNNLKLEKIFTTLMRVMKKTGWNGDGCLLIEAFDVLGYNKFIKLLPNSAIIPPILSEKIFDNMGFDVAKKADFANKFFGKKLFISDPNFHDKPGKMIMENLDNINDLEKFLTKKKLFDFKDLNLTTIAMNYDLKMLERFYKFYPKCIENREFLTFLLMSFYSKPIFTEKFMKNYPMVNIKTNYQMKNFISLINMTIGNDYLAMRGFKNMIDCVVNNGLDRNDVIRFGDLLYEENFHMGRCACCNEDSIVTFSCLNCKLYRLNPNCLFKYFNENSTCNYCNSSLNQLERAEYDFE
jgi:hypothetical protein